MIHNTSLFFFFFFWGFSGILGSVSAMIFLVSCIAIIHLSDIHFVYVIPESDYYPTLLRLV